jgi:hypothetical protein
VNSPAGFGNLHACKEFTLSVRLSALLAPREDVLRVLVYSTEGKLSYSQKGSLINTVY